MNMELGLLVLTAVSIGFVHTVLGPDHYLPFVAMSAARNWTRRKTMLVTAFCGVGHVLGSIVIGFVGIAIGASLHRLQWLEGVRGDLAAWALIAFGLVYMVWGLKQAWRSRKHSHEHIHSDGTRHRHTHGDGHAQAPHLPAADYGWQLSSVWISSATTTAIGRTRATGWIASGSRCWPRMSPRASACCRSMAGRAGWPR